MKKIVSILLASIIVVASAPAQESQSSTAKAVRTEKVYTPQIGDLGLSVDMLAPVMTYIGNIFNSNTNNTFPSKFSGPDYNGAVSISGKYFIYEDFALRASISLDNTRTTSSSYVRDDAAFAADPSGVAQVTDARTLSNNNMYVSLGAEIRRGYARLQGFYGAQVICGYESQKTSYSYGNAITSDNNTPSHGYVTTPVNNIGGNSRLLDTNVSGGRNLLLGLGGFVGVEYFILPKMAIGGEIALTGTLIFGGQQREKSERYNTTSSQVEENTRLYSDGTNSANLSTHNFGNSFYVAFYF